MKNVSYDKVAQCALPNRQGCKIMRQDKNGEGIKAIPDNLSKLCENVSMRRNNEIYHVYKQTGNHIFQYCATLILSCIKTWSRQLLFRPYHDTWYILWYFCSKGLLKCLDCATKSNITHFLTIYLDIKTIAILEGWLLIDSNDKIK